MKRIASLTALTVLLLAAAVPSVVAAPPAAEQFLNEGKNGVKSEAPAAAEGESTPAVPASPAAPAAAAASSAAETALMTKLIENAVLQGTFLIRQPYFAKDHAGKFYKYKGNAKGELGEVFSLGLNINGGYIFSNRAVAPWEYDTEYTKKKGEFDGGVSPSTTTYSFLSKKAGYQPLDFDMDKAGNIYPGNIYSMPVPYALFESGFEINREKGEREGFLVWISPALNQDLNKDASLNFDVVYRKIQVPSDPKELISLGSGHSNALGVVYVVPEVNGIGNIVLYLEGVGVFDTASGRWSLAFPFGDEEDIFKKEQLVKPEKKVDAPAASDAFELMEQPAADAGSKKEEPAATDKDAAAPVKKAEAKAEVKAEADSDSDDDSEGFSSDILD